LLLRLTGLATLLPAANKKGSWIKARISYRRCACRRTIWKFNAHRRAMAFPET